MILACLKPLILLILPFVVAWLITSYSPIEARWALRLVALAVAVQVVCVAALPMAMITAVALGDAVDASLADGQSDQVTAMTVAGKTAGSWLTSTGGFGRLYKDEQFSASTLHGLAGFEGVDVVGSETIHAPFDGTVIKQGCDTWQATGLPGGYHPTCRRAATWLEMKSSDGQYRTILLHGDYTVATGETVRKGQPVGTQNCWGWCTGPHTHIIVYDAAGRVLNYASLRDSQPGVVAEASAPVVPDAAPDSRMAMLVNGLAKLSFPGQTAVAGTPGQNPLRVSHYDPSLGGTNCDSDCSTMASGEKVANWVGGVSGIYAAACPTDWPFGTRFELLGKTYQCQDRGGWIKTRQPGEYDPAMGGFTAAETYHWVDLLDNPPVPYGTLIYDWKFID